MGSNLKNFLFVDPARTIIVQEDNPSDITSLPDSENDILKNHELAIPEIIGILPIRNAVAFPGTVTPLAIGRDRSKALLQDTKTNKTVIGLITQRNPQTEEPTFDDLYAVGTTASVLKVIKFPQGPMHIVVHGLSRFKIIEPVTTQPYLKARIQPLEVATKMSKKLQALMVSVRQTASRVIQLSPNVPEEAAVLLENIENPSALADFLTANLNIDITKKQQLLEELDTIKRLEQVSLALANQLEVLELSHKIQGRVRESVEKNQREYFLQEQLKAIQTELGKDDRRTEEIKELTENIKKAKMPEKVEAEAMRELDRLSKMIPASRRNTASSGHISTGSASCRGRSRRWTSST